MKNIKSNLIAGITAITLLFGVFIAVKAMQKDTHKKDQQKIVSVTWYFNGAVDNDPTNPDNYTSNPPTTPCDDTPEQICEILAPNSSGKPDMLAPSADNPSQTVQDKINEAHQSITDPNQSPTLNSTVTAFRSL
ncbi:hypothetical protein [Sphingobacterium bovisgrunnientis]|uniref:hypothetical protein n=1 Tax=Sphingobacterium bovisgrunnientis TaxID=1874697 RepID=UPI00135C7DE7|nr:hypothetical protein [Sphingobacterium bovisgrunnientis]